MKLPRLSVDFNEMLEADLVLLSKTDTRSDSSGQTVALSDGLVVQVYEDDLGGQGQPDALVAEGRVERNNSGVDWASHAKWCCRIGPQGIRHKSEV